MIIAMPVRCSRASVKPAGDVLREIVAHAEAVLRRQTDAIRAGGGSTGTAG